VKGVKMKLTWENLKQEFSVNEATSQEIANKTGWNYNRVCVLANIMFEAGELQRRKQKHHNSLKGNPWIYSIVR
jgi:hypothetical protein